MKSAIVFSLAIVPALTGFLAAAEPLDAPQIATNLLEALPPEPVAKKPAGPPIGLVIRVYEMDTRKHGPSIDFCPQKEDRKTVNAQFETFRKSGFVQVLAEPHLVTQDGRPATFLSGGEVPVLTPAGKDSVAIDWFEFGTRIAVTPQRVKQDQVQVRISAEFTRRADQGLTGDNETTPILVGRTIKAATTLGPKDIVVLNDREARKSGEPSKVIFMTIELAQADVEAALLQFGEGVPAPPRNVPARETAPASPFSSPPVAPGRETSVDLPDPIETGGQPADISTTLSGTVRPARKKGTVPAGNFFLKPGKTQLELTRGTWRSITIPSKEFSYGSSMLVESPEDGAVSISGRLLEPQMDGPAKTETFEAEESGEKYFADIWTIKGTKAGIATIRLMDGDDQEYEIEVTVKGDTRHFDAMVKRFHPNAKVEAHELTQDSIVITGEASSEDGVAIQEIAEQLYANVLLRLKTQPAPVSQFNGHFPGSDNSKPDASTYPKSETGTASEVGSNAFAPGATVGDSYANPTPLNSNAAVGYGPVKLANGGSRSGQEEPDSVLENGDSDEGYIDTGSGELTPSNAAGVAQSGDETGQLATTNVGFRAAGRPAAPTTQIRFLNSGFISMQTSDGPGSFKKVQSWDSWSTWRFSGGQQQQVRYSTHRENIPLGSQTRLQFRTTEFRDDVWVNAVLLTSSANDRTRYHLQHFPVNLELQNHEVIAAARGELVTRYVVLKDPNRALARTKNGEAEEPLESFTGPNSFEEAIVESRKHGELLAVLVLGPESKLQREFTLPQSDRTDDWEQEWNPYSNLKNPYGDVTIEESSKRLNKPAETPSDESSSWQARPAASVSAEMRQLRNEVRSLREQLGKLVEVLSEENRTKPGIDSVPLGSRPVSDPDPIDRGPEDGFGTSDEFDSGSSSTLVPSPSLEEPRPKTLRPSTRLFESESNRIVPGTPLRKPSTKPGAEPLGEERPEESGSVLPPESPLP